MHNTTHYYPIDATLVNDIAIAINGEYSAIACYEKLARMAPNAEVKNQILEIRNDEIKHFHVFSHIYTALTGMQPEPQVTEQCPSEYFKGLSSAFHDEQKTVDVYMEIADKSNDPYIKEQFKRAATDEQNHAVWFLFFLTQRFADRRD